MTVSVEQLEAFVSVTRHGSFSAAGRSLGKAQSAISTAIQHLEIDLGVELFSREGRYPVLTAAGAALLKDAGAVLEDRSMLMERGYRLSEGEPVELTLAILSMLPLHPVFDALATFRKEHPVVRLRLVLVSAGDATRMINSPTGPTLAFSLLAGVIARQNIVRNLGMLPLVAVAAPDTQLAEHRGQVPGDLLRTQLQIVLTDREPEALPDQGVYSRETWRVTDLRAKHELLRAGFGWGFMPLPLVEDDLRSRRLVKFGSELWGDRIETQLSAVATGHPDVGDAGRALFARLRHLWGEELSRCCGAM